jgi:hypothetical protein
MICTNFGEYDSFYKSWVNYQIIYGLDETVFGISEIQKVKFLRNKDIRT